MPNLNRYSVSQASRETGIPKRTLIAAIARGELKASKLGDGATSAYVINAADLDDFLTERSA